MVFVLILFNCLTGYSQTEFAPIGAEWYYNYREGAHTPATGYFNLKSIKDTIIDSKYCKILSRTFVNSNGISFNGGQNIVYQDTKENKIYRYLYGSFYLLYDFNKLKGDTIVIKEPYSSSRYDSIVTVVDSVGIETFSDNLKLKTLYLHNIDQFKYVFSGKIIENIGNLYFFFPVNSMDCDGGCPQPLRCYNDNQIDFSSVLFPCDTVYTKIDIMSSAEISVYPNPFTNSFTIRNGNHGERFLSIDIVTQLGKSILHDVIFGNMDHLINLEGYSCGIYYLTIKTSKDNVTYKLIKNRY